MKRSIRLLFMTLLFALLLGTAYADTVITSKEQLNQPGMKVGVSTGSASVLIVEKELPEAEIVYYETDTTAYMAVAQGKLDAYVYDRRQMQMAIDSGLGGVHLLDENMNEDVHVAVGVSPVSSIPDLTGKLNAYFAEIKSSGELDEMLRRWTVDRDERMPEIAPAENPQYHLTVGTSGIVRPYSYYVGTELNGFDIELARRFAAWLGADVTFKVYDYGAIIPAAQTGDVDCVMANLNVTPERAEALTFTDDLYVEQIAIMVRGDASEPAGTTSPADAESGASSFASLSGKRIGVQTSTTFDEIVLEAFPEAQISYYNTYPDMAAALQANKIDAFPGDEPVIQLMASENDRLTILDGRLDSFEFGFVMPKTAAGEALRDEINAWLSSIKASGELDALTRKWTEGPESEKTLLDYAALPAPKGTLKMATEGAYAPMNYYRGNELVGMEIDLAARFCEAAGYGLTVEAMNFDGILTAVQAGKADFAGAGITITEERKESVYFSDAYYTGGTVLAVLRTEDVPAVPTGVYSTLAEMNGKRIGVQTGTSFDKAVSEQLPDAQVLYFNSKADLVNALLSNKIDAYTVDEPVAKAQMAQDDRVTYIPEYMESFEFGYVFPKTDGGQALCDQFSEYLRAIRADGTMAEVEAKWFSEDDSRKTIADYSDFPAPNGKLRMATEALYEPFSYILNNRIVGYDIDIAVRFCEAYGYGLEITDMNFDAVLPSVQSGKHDFGCAGITITEERAESVLFSEPNFSGGSVLAVLKSDSAAQAAVEQSAFSQLETEQTAPPATIESSADQEKTFAFLDGLRDSFNKTFLREERWRLFVDGVLTTLIITILSILCGTALGFGVFMLCRKGNIVANGASRFSMWLVQGMPMVVLLMILYYVIFGSVAISGMSVAVIGFTLTFGAAVFGLLKMGVGAVDNGQYEAAYALGYPNRRTFFKIILPQALPHVMPAFRGEIVGLIKATAIVGYIAVQDLTKMGDIVRSRTYEAFFPLIAVTVIYFLLEGLLSFLVGRIEIRLNPKRRRQKTILKGVKTDD